MTSHDRAACLIATLATLLIVAVFTIAHLAGIPVFAGA